MCTLLWCRQNVCVYKIVTKNRKDDNFKGFLHPLLLIFSWTRWDQNVCGTKLTPLCYGCIHINTCLKTVAISSSWFQMTEMVWCFSSEVSSDSKKRKKHSVAKEAWNIPAGERLMIFSSGCWAWVCVCLGFRFWLLTSVSWQTRSGEKHGLKGDHKSDEQGRRENSRKQNINTSALHFWNP